MRALVVYESMYGNTHVVADAIARGLARDGEVTVVPVDEARGQSLHGVDLLVVGGPTHVHTLSRPSTRRAAIEATRSEKSDLHLDPAAGEFGLRDWLESLPSPPHGWRARASSDQPTGHGLAAAFDTRADAPAALTGRASREIGRQLHHHGFDLVVDPESFFVGRKDGGLETGEERRAETWGRSIAAAAVAALGRSPATATGG